MLDRFRLRTLRTAIFIGSLTLAGSLTFEASAQVSAAISGTVVDESGARVSDATVTARNANLGLERTTTTDAAGRYELGSMGVGDYEVDVTKQGFKEEARKGVQLVVGQEAIVNVQLHVGPVTDQVTIEGDAPAVGATTSDISGLVGGVEISNLPLNGRSFDLLTMLNPGVANFTSAKVGGTGVSNSTNGNNFAVSGNRPQQNIFLLNGVEFTGAAENNMQPGGTSGQLLGVDAIEEFNMLRDDYGADYGKRPGAQVLLVTRRGSNHLHASLYEFLRNNDLDAPNYFDTGSAPGFQRNQYGGSLGGPISRDRTFGFVNVEGLNQHLHQTGVDLVPDSNARAGYLPCTLVTPAPSPCPASGVVFVGTSSLVSAWPAPSASGPDFGGIAEAFNTPRQVIRDDFGTARVDHTFSKADTLNGIYTIDDSADNTPTSTNLYSTDIESLREQVASLGETHVFSPRLLNQGTIGFSRAAYYFTGEPTPGTPAASLPGFLAGRPIGAIVVGGSATSNPTAQLSLAGSNNGSNLDAYRNLFTYEDHMSFTRGRHQFSGGIWLERFQSNEKLALSQYGQATFTSLETFLEGVASSLLYDPAPTEMNWRALFGAWYVEDTIRLTPYFAATLGFRAESDSGWKEAHGRAATYTFPNGVISTQPQVSGSLLTKNDSTFLPQPRVGLAWSPFHGLTQTVLKAAFGMYNDLQDALGYRTDQNAPFNPTYSLPNANVTTLPLITSAAAPPTAKLVPGGVQPDLRTPTLISYTLRLEQELSPNTALRIGYVGSHGYHELIGIDANEPAPVVCPNPACPAAYPSNFPQGLAGTAIPAGTYYVPTSVRANPALANTWTYFSRGDSSYNSLEIDLNHRFSKGLSLRGVYTWSRAIDDGDSPNSTTSGGEPATASNPYNLRADRGLANYNASHVAVLSEVYALPFGCGAHSGSSLTRHLVSGWMIDGIATIQGGFPFTPQLSYNPSNNGDTRNPVRPFANPNFMGPVIKGNPSQWFNPSAFLAPANGSGFYGNLGRDTLIGPGLGTWDMAFVKETPLGEGLKVQFRAEEFNILDRTNFSAPNAVTFTPTGVSPTAGLVTSTSTSSRQTQFALKFLW